VGQGMNAGVRDAYNLAWKLAAVLRGHGTSSLLDSYQAERMPHAKAMIDTSILMKNYVSVSNPLLSALRDTATWCAKRTPGLRDYFSKGKFKPLPRYLPGHYFGLSRRRRSSPEGEQIPQPTVAERDGRRRLLDDVLGEGFSLIGFGVDPRAGLSAAERASLDRLDIRYVTVFPLGGRPQGERVARSSPEGLPELEDCTGELTRWLKKAGHGPGAVAVIRPDKFTYALVRAGDLPRTVRQLTGQLDLAGAGAEPMAA